LRLFNFQIQFNKMAEHTTTKHTKKDTDSYKSYIRKVLAQVHPEIRIGQSATDVIDSLVKTMLSKIKEQACKLTLLKGGKTIDTKILTAALELFLPTELAKHAIAEGTKAVTKFHATTLDATTQAAKAGLIFNVGRVKRHLKDNITLRVSADTPVFLAAVLEYMTAEILELAGRNAESRSRKTIDSKAVHYSIREDDELSGVFSDALIVHAPRKRSHKQRSASPHQAAPAEAEQPPAPKKTKAAPKKRARKETTPTAATGGSKGKKRTKTARP
jgi:histone H2B